jgi:hypothetical protein
MGSPAIRFIQKYGYALAASAYLFTAGVRSPRNRAMISEIARHFGFVPEPELIPEVALAQLAPDPRPLKLLEPESQDGNVSLFELVSIICLLQLRDPSRCFEIGTFDGRTTLNLAANTRPEVQVFTLDLPPLKLDCTSLPLEHADRKFIKKQRSGARFVGRPEAGKITQLYGDSATFDFEPYAGSVDFVFVDGAHSYEYVRSDSCSALQLLRGNRGTILWHDYGSWPGVTQGLNELFLSGPKPFRDLRRIRNSSLVVLHTQPMLRDVL